MCNADKTGILLIIQDTTFFVGTPISDVVERCETGDTATSLKLIRHGTILSIIWNFFIVTAYGTDIHFPLFGANHVIFFFESEVHYLQVIRFFTVLEFVGKPHILLQRIAIQRDTSTALINQDFR